MRPTVTNEQVALALGWARDAAGQWMVPDGRYLTSDELPDFIHARAAAFQVVDRVRCCGRVDKFVRLLIVYVHGREVWRHAMITPLMPDQIVDLMTADPHVLCQAAVEALK